MVEVKFSDKLFTPRVYEDAYVSVLLPHGRDGVQAEYLTLLAGRDAALTGVFFDPGAGSAQASGQWTSDFFEVEIDSKVYRYPIKLACRGLLKLAKPIPFDRQRDKLKLTAPWSGEAILQFLTAYDVR